MTLLLERNTDVSEPDIHDLAQRLALIELRMAAREMAAVDSRNEHVPLRSAIGELERQLDDPEKGVFSQIAALRAEVRQNRRDIIVAVGIIMIAANFIVPYIIAALGGP